MTPKWFCDTVTAFGRHLGLSSFAFNERGVAGVRFENGTTFRLECFEERVWLSVGVPFAAKSPDAYAKLLAEAHPLWQRGASATVRAAFFENTQEGRLVMAFPMESADETVLDAAFRDLWDRAERVRKAT